MAQGPISPPWPTSPCPSSIVRGLVSSSVHPCPGQLWVLLSQAHLQTHVLSQHLPCLSPGRCLVPRLGFSQCPVAALLLARVVGWALSAKPCPDEPQGTPATPLGEPLAPLCLGSFSFSFSSFHFSLLHFPFSCISAFRKQFCLISLKAGSSGAFWCLMKQIMTSSIFCTA